MVGDSYIGEGAASTEVLAAPWDRARGPWLLDVLDEPNNGDPVVIFAAGIESLICLRGGSDVTTILTNSGLFISIWVSGCVIFRGCGSGLHPTVPALPYMGVGRR